MQAIQNQENKIVYNPGSFTLNSLKKIFNHGKSQTT